ncbi:sensor histidine kinase [Sphingomonas sp. KC8]|uniref:sensor histidine kinase n=1 Tax=Sphingomonas sp. KC8 TaxID=1030157 RepID=UPI0002488532|nr:histidine kinase [Sphingomonas sp. KC8]ARS28565.1 signal transduction histidine kinase [Sphingomonas sp. KC8]
MNLNGPPRARLSHRVVILSIVGFWLFYFTIITLRAAGLGYDHQVEMLAYRAIVTLAGMALTLLFYLVLRGPVSRSLKQAIIVAALFAVPAAIAYSTVNWLVFYRFDEKAMFEKKQKKAATVIIRKGETVPPVAPPPLPSPPGQQAAPPAPPVPPAPPSPTTRQVTIQVGGDEEEYLHEEKTPIMAIADQAANGYFFFVAWAALYLALSYAAAVRGAEREAAELRAAAQSAELRALRYQVNPHFLFNTLNSLSSLVLTDKKEEAERMILNLSTFFRTSLTADPTEDVPLYEEIRLQRLYLDIEAVRFPDRLKVEVEVPDPLRTACVPGLILQPLVENAVKYGVSRARRPVTIRIRAREDSDGLVLSVEDDGDPMTENDRIAGTGVGLRNVRERLAARFGGDSRCRWGALPDGGFSVTLFLPLNRNAC